MLTELSEAFTIWSLQTLLWGAQKPRVTPDWPAIVAYSSAGVRSHVPYPCVTVAFCPLCRLGASKGGLDKGSTS